MGLPRSSPPQTCAGGGQQRGHTTHDGKYKVLAGIPGVSPDPRGFSLAPVPLPALSSPSHLAAARAGSPLAAGEAAAASAGSLGSACSFQQPGKPLFVKQRWRHQMERVSQRKSSRKKKKEKKGERRERARSRRQAGSCRAPTCPQHGPASTRGDPAGREEQGLAGGEMAADKPTCELPALN